jgi:AcrR family transcriptional regulator
MARPSVEALRREQILKSTCKVVAKRGVAGLRISDVAKDVGFSTGTIHYYFDDKESLLRAAFEYNVHHSIERRQELLASTIDPLELLTRYVDSYLPDDRETVRAWRVWAEFWAASIRDTELREFIDILDMDWRAQVGRIIRQGQADGVFRAGDPLGYTNMLIGLVDGLAVQVLSQSKEMDVAIMADTLHSFIDEFLAVDVSGGAGA